MVNYQPNTLNFMEAQLMKSFAGLSFGASQSEATRLFGKPEETENLQAIDGSESLVWHYWSRGFTIFFDKPDQGRFCCVEIDRSVKLRLWNEPVFDLDENSLKALFKKRGFKEIDEETHDWGEKRISFDDAMVDFYFEKGLLVSINFGVVVAEIPAILPN
jgi:hypothetical protein